MENNFIELLDANQNLIHKVCRIYTNDKDSHKDLFQEISIQLWKSYKNFRGDAKFTTWMYKVALNTAITLYRKNKKHHHTQDVDLYQNKLEYKEYDDTETQQLKLIYQAIDHLSDIEKGLVFLYLEDKDYREIAELIGISVVNARVKMNRIKNKLKAILNP